MGLAGTSGNCKKRKFAVRVRDADYYRTYAEQAGASRAALVVMESARQPGDV